MLKEEYLGEKCAHLCELKRNCWSTVLSQELFIFQALVGTVSSRYLGCAAVQDVADNAGDDMQSMAGLCKPASPPFCVPGQNIQQCFPLHFKTLGEALLKMQMP